MYIGEKQGRANRARLSPLNHRFSKFNYELDETRTEGSVTIRAALWRRAFYFGAQNSMGGNNTLVGCKCYFRDRVIAAFFDVYFPPE